MEYEERTAAAAYVDSEHGEPISSMKQVRPVPDMLYLM